MLGGRPGEGWGAKGVASSSVGRRGVIVRGVGTAARLATVTHEPSEPVFVVQVRTPQSTSHLRYRLLLCAGL